jgi:hypothetical protein
MEKKSKTRIMAVGDLHGDASLVRKLAKKAKEKEVDIVILAGDLTLFEISRKNIIGPFLDKKRNVLIISGNHDSPETIDYLSKKYSVFNLEKNYFKKGSLAIFGAGGASDIGPYVREEKEIFDSLKNAHNKIVGAEITKKIMVTHTHPYGSKSEFTGFKGSRAVRRAVKKFKPNILIHGHIHEASGIEEKIGGTRIFNVARKGKIFEI